ncbi:protein POLARALIZATION DURING ASYMMETRIC DIVISION AND REDISTRIBUTION-like [Euphorbia lathyris]|uniref:protein POLARALIZATION DURING ASYMMETRIC DIVISION AND REDISTRIBUTION-like n=1 Tax=Euphorbia lathyris TaxID=212925 RepID=UPI003313A63C
MNPFPDFNNSLNPSFSSPKFHPPLRISDILFDHHDITDRHDLNFMGRSGRRINCSSLRKIVTRWLSRLRRSRVKRVAGESVKIEGDENRVDDQTAKASCSTIGLNERNSGDSSSSETGRSTDCANFNLGIGCCLVYLLAASKNELHKMIEMRMQMESLLRDELLKKDELNMRSEPNNIFANTQGSPSLPESSTVTICDQSCKCETPEREECLEEEEEGMDRLQAELEAELELLQHHLDSEKLLKPPEQVSIKVDDEIENTTSSISQGLSNGGEVIDPPYQEEESVNGVPPHVLERKLHELLESRQQEQIRELESALECLKHKLHEKELEVAWWRDTAKIISQHSTDPSFFAS